MKGEIALCLIVALCGMCQLCWATSCSADTGNTCVKSLFMTGVCSNDVCQCTAGYTPGPYGCQVLQKSVVTTVFNGQAKTGSSPKLTCNGATPVEWKKDGQLINGETGLEYTISAAATTATGGYTCKSIIAGITAEESDAYDLEVVDSLTRKPIVEGMPTKFKTGDGATLSCTKLPLETGSAISTAFKWFKNSDTAVVGQAASTYVFTVTASEYVQCASESNAALKSEQVLAPSAASPDITGLEITTRSVNLLEGEELKLSCDYTDGFIAASSTTYAWSKDATPGLGTGQKFEKTSVAVADTGTYKCEADGKSAEIVITVSNDIVKDEIKVSSNKVLEDGYFSLSCNFKSATSTNTISYVWKEDANVIAGVTDKVLQFNKPKDTYNSDYTCDVITQLGTATNDEVTISALGSTAFEAAPNSISVEGNPASYGIGNSYTFKCTGDYYTPGAVYEWHVGTDKQSESSDTFKYKVTSDTAATIKCQYKFGSSSMTEATKSVTGKYIFSVDVKSNGEKATAIDPLINTVVELECGVEKSEDAGAVSYAWEQDGSPVDGQTSKTYKITTTAAKTLKIKCSATVNGKKEESPELTATFDDIDPKKPDTTKGEGDPIRGGSYYFTCDSSSFAEGATFQWKKGSDIIDGATSYKLKFDGLKQSDDGLYTCAITLNSKQSAFSTGGTLTTEEDKVVCTYAQDCDGENFDNTVCVDKKCKCKMGFVYNLKTCSGAGSVMASLVVMVLAAIAARLF